MATALLISGLVDGLWYQDKECYGVKLCSLLYAAPRDIMRPSSDKEES